MSESGSSPLWDSIAQLKPRLRPHVRVHRHCYRGQTWYVVQDPASGRYHRFSADAYQLIGRMDGGHSLEAIAATVSASSADQAPTQQELVELVARLHSMDLLRLDLPVRAGELFERYQQGRRRAWQGRLLRPLALRFPLIDPERWLARTVSLVRPLFSPAGMLLWLALVGVALVQAAAHWPELTGHWTRQALDPWNLLLLWLTYPLVKGLHELGHAYATKVWGGEVHEMGIMLLVLMPIPYVDASAATAFRDKRKRMIVGAAGIMVELALAALALFVWLGVQPGLVRDVAFNVLLIGGASTVLFNGNPLLRFDGYYVLADAIEIPNLGPRANGYLGYLVQRYLFGVVQARSPASAPGERGWFVVYGIASMLYRLVIMFVIALFVAGRLFVVGVVLAIWALAAGILLPAGKYGMFLLRAPALQGRRLRAVTVVGGLIALVGVLVTVPVSSWTHAVGVVRVPERALVRAGADAFVVRPLAAPGAPVGQGQALFETDDPVLRARVPVLEGELQALETRHAQQVLRDRVEADILHDEIARLKEELAEARARVARLVIRSPAEGTFLVPRAENLPGRFVRQGDVVGYVTRPSGATARVVVPQADVGQVRARTGTVEVRLASDPGKTLTAVIDGEVPSATNRLPSRALGRQGGGAIAVDPADGDGTRALDRIFQFDLTLPAGGSRYYLGTRVYVRFQHGAEPLARRWYRGLRQLFLARFEV